MGTTGASQNSFTVDAETQLKDAGAVTSSGAAQVGGSARVLDFGNVDSNGVVNVAYTPGSVLIDVSAMTVGTGDETYQLMVELSDDASGNGVGFDAGDNVKARVMIPMGDLTTLLAGVDLDDDEALGRVVLGCDNEHKGVVYQFMRVVHVIAGTTPSVDYTAYWVRNR